MASILFRLPTMKLVIRFSMATTIFSGYADYHRLLLTLVITNTLNYTQYQNTSLYILYILPSKKAAVSLQFPCNLFAQMKHLPDVDIFI